MFVPHTHSSALAKKLREIENNMGGMTGSKVKIVEKAGIALEDILTSSNPWKGQPCNRLTKTSNRNAANVTWYMRHTVQHVRKERGKLLNQRWMGRRRGRGE